MPVPANAKAIYGFLTSHGLNANAAAGILGNLEQESGGNPESTGSGGGGLYGATPLPAGQVTGNAVKDLAAQLGALMNYIAQNGSVSDINAHATDPVAAASYFMVKYERPNSSQANASNRTQSALDVANAAKSGNWPASSSITPAKGTPSSSPSSSPGGGVLGIPSQITNFFTDANGFVTKIMWLFKPSNWLRIGAFLAGVALALFALHAFIATMNGEPIIQAPNVIPVPV